MRSEFYEPTEPGRGNQSEPETTARLPRTESFSLWDYGLDVGWSPEYDMSGYHVEAADGSVGKVSQSVYATHGSYLTVATGPWIFGRTVVIPAGIVSNIDHAGRRIYLDRGKDQIKSAPDYSDEPAFWDKLAGHYSNP